jgi:hypothetical protein
MDISILISTIRPELVKDVVRAINSVETSYSYEILIYTPEKINLPNVKCLVKDPVETSVVAYNLLYDQSTGDCIICLVDDHIPVGNWPGVYDDLKSDMFEGRKTKVVHLSWDDNYATSRLVDLSPLKEGCDPEAKVPHFHAFLRSTIDSHLDGVIHNEEFKHHYVDIWLGFYLSKLGEPPVLSGQCYLKPLLYNSKHTNSFQLLLNSISHDDVDKETCVKLMRGLNEDIHMGYNKSFTSPVQDSVCEVARMTKPLLSIIIPGIRTYNWTKLYRSVLDACSQNFEIIFCGPDPLPSELERFYNVKYVRDFGSPVRCSNIAMSLCEGPIVTYAADDGVFLKDTLDWALKTFLEMGPNLANILSWKYIESNNKYPDNYYTINHHKDLRSSYIPNAWLILNGSIMYRDYFYQIGGWDNGFKTTSWAHTDLAIRAQASGANVRLLGPQAIFDCYQEKSDGDHGPIEKDFVDHDRPLYHEIYQDPLWFSKLRHRQLDISSYKHDESIWRSRFPCTEFYEKGVL